MTDYILVILLNGDVSLSRSLENLPLFDQVTLLPPAQTVISLHSLTALRHVALLGRFSDAILCRGISHHVAFNSTSLLFLQGRSHTALAVPTCCAATEAEESFAVGFS